MNTQTFVRYENDRRLYTCRNPLCDRLTVAMFCCLPCSDSHGYLHDPHHTSSCDARHEERSNA